MQMPGERRRRALGATTRTIGGFGITTLTGALTAVALREPELTVEPDGYLSTMGPRTRDSHPMVSMTGPLEHEFRSKSNQDPELPITAMRNLYLQVDSW